METSNLTFDRNEAKALWRKYQEHRHWSEPIDHEIRQAYRHIARGRMIIRALDSVIKAGQHVEEGQNYGMPKLALCRMTARACFCSISQDGSCTMTADNTRARISWGRGSAPSGTIMSQRGVMSWPAGSFTYMTKSRNWRRQALVPPVPLHIRPKRGLENYAILWEAEWSNAPPNDPFLLRRIGKSDMWLVCAHWDLTPIEQAALATRI